MTRKPRTILQLKEFGQVMTIASLVCVCLGLWKRQTLTPIIGVLLVLALVFYALSVFAPERLKRAEALWMAFAERLGAVVTFLVMMITYFVIVTPIGLFLRLIGKDILSLKLDKNRQSYWEPVDPQGPASRPFLPY